MQILDAFFDVNLIKVIEQKVEMLVIRDATTLMWRYCQIVKGQERWERVMTHSSNFAIYKERIPPRGKVYVLSRLSPPGVRDVIARVIGDYPLQCVIDRI